MINAVFAKITTPCEDVFICTMSDKWNKSTNLQRQWCSSKGRHLDPGPVGAASAVGAAAVFRDLSLSQWLPPLCGAAVWLEPGKVPASCQTLCWSVLLASLRTELLGADEPRDAWRAKGGLLDCCLTRTVIRAPRWTDFWGRSFSSAGKSRKGSFLLLLLSRKQWMKS